MNGYTRVTEVLYPLSGLKSIPQEIVAKAAERGNRAHQACDAIMSDIGLGNVDEDIKGYIESFNHWVGDKKFLDKPDRWYCDKYMLTGECDGVYEEGKDLILFDIKTPAKESSTWKLQLSAYAYLAMQAGLPITKIEVIRLNKDGKPAEVIRYEENFDLYLKCLDVYRYFYKDNECESYIDFL